MANTMISMNNFAISFMNYYIANLQIKYDNDNHTLEKLHSQTGKNDSSFIFSLFKKEPASALFVPPIITLSQERCI